MADQFMCWQEFFSAETFLDPVVGPVPHQDMRDKGQVFSFIPEIGPIRLPPLAYNTMVHVIHNGCSPCLRVKVERVVQCPGDCEFDEYKWEICTRDTPHFLLPPGVYDLTICSQMICELDEGDTFEGSFLLEPVPDSFVHAFRINEGCC